MNPYSPQAFFDLDNTLAAALFTDIEYVWDAVAALPAFIEKHLQPEILGEVEGDAWLEPGLVSLGAGSRVERGSIIHGPTIIGRNTTVRSGAYIRGHVMIGDGCTIGWGSEMRQTLVLNNSRISHDNGVHTSLIGNRSNMTGKACVANSRLDGKEVKVRVPVQGKMQSFHTGQTLFGAIIGDDSIVGAFSLLQPATVIGRRCVIYSQANVSGYIPHDSLVKPRGEPFVVLPRT